MQSVPRLVRRRPQNGRRRVRRRQSNENRQVRAPLLRGTVYFVPKRFGRNFFLRLFPSVRLLPEFRTFAEFARQRDRRQRSRSHFSGTRRAGRGKYQSRDRWALYPADIKGVRAVPPEDPRGVQHPFLRKNRSAARDRSLYRRVSSRPQIFFAENFAAVYGQGKLFRIRLARGGIYDEKAARHAGGQNVFGVYRAASHPAALPICCARTTAWKSSDGFSRIRATRTFR